MDEKPHSEFHDEQLVLRDHLALDRMELANERTLLAYVRIALVILVVGASLLKFLPTEAYEAIGAALIPVGLGVLLFGVARFRKTAASIRVGRCATGPSAQQALASRRSPEA